MECLGSCLTNKYSEGYPHHRYYGGNEHIDEVEELCQKRALEAYHLDSNEWGVNVQPYSGSPANLAVYTGLLHPHARIMGLDLPSGGHLTHGYYSWNPTTLQKKSISATSIFFESLPYSVNAETGLIDYDRLADLAKTFKPDLIICGGSAYPREWDYKRYREIADANGAILMMDMAHISGLVATGEALNPFEYCDIVTTTTHKSLRGPRAGMIFYKKDSRDFEKKISDAVFPALQGGPHEHQIAGIATQLLEVNTPEFKEYAHQIRLNAIALGNRLKSHGYKLVTDGTDNHLLLLDLRPNGLTGNKLEKVCDEVNITVNKNAIHGDRSAFTPGGVRIGTPALTTRGLKEADFEKVGDFLDRAIKISLDIQKEVGKKLVDFLAALPKNKDIEQLRHDVSVFATSFPMPGFNVDEMTVKEI